MHNRLELDIEALVWSGHYCQYVIIIFNACLYVCMDVLWGVTDNDTPRGQSTPLSVIYLDSILLKSE